MLDQNMIAALQGPQAAMGLGPPPQQGLFGVSPEHLQRMAGDVVMMAGFAHAGDFAGAAAVRWGGRN